MRSLIVFGVALGAVYVRADDYWLVVQADPDACRDRWATVARVAAGRDLPLSKIESHASGNCAPS